MDACVKSTYPLRITLFKIYIAVKQYFWFEGWMKSSGR